MSNIKLSRISNKSKTSGPVITGITTFTGKQSARLPIGDNSERVGIESGSLRYNDTAGLLEFYDGTSWNFIIPAEESANALGVFSGGGFGVADPRFSEMEYITISTTGNATDFGDLIFPVEELGSCASSTRGIFAGGQSTGGSVTNTINFITISSKGNGADFGDLIGAKEGLGGLSNSVRGIFSGSWTAYSNLIEYITIATTGNAVDFNGDLLPGRSMPATCASATRGIFAGGYYETPTYTAINTMDFVTIATTGQNSSDFGNLTRQRGAAAGCSSSTRGVFGGGEVGIANVIVADIDYITIATTGNAQYFGDLSNGQSYFGACSSSTRGVFDMNYYGTYEYVTISTTGNSSYFGDSIYGSRPNKNGALSNNHGGLL
jgi:hypothetical protein